MYERRTLSVLLLFILINSLWLPSTAAISLRSQAVIGGLLWRDYNGNGLQDEDDGMGIDGVVVRLFRDDGDALFELNGDDILIVETTTANDGEYRFLADVGAVYWVDVDETTLPVGLSLSPGPQSGPEPNLVLLNQDVFNIDFGYSPRGGVSGTIFYDYNMDGVQGLGENGAPDIEVCLHDDANADGRLDAADPLRECTFTDHQGNYLLDGLLYGHYVIVESEQPGVGYSTPHIIPVFLDPWLVSSTTAAPIGLVLLADVSGALFVDANHNGRRDPDETGLSGVTVTVSSLAGGDSVVTQSNADGVFLASNLMPGPYRITIPKRPVGYILNGPEAVDVELDFGEKKNGVDFPLAPLPQSAEHPLFFPMLRHPYP
ncbi:MAG: hypothetical protein GXP42_16305 [Chloroflexi bacterium]|nr:hypothetical protein [Chloroflexota bacterium]